MNRRITAAAIGVLLLAAPVLAACGDAPAGEVASGQAFVAGDGSIVEVPAADRKAAPAFTGQTLDGDTFALADHIGEVVVVNVWASWCAPCRGEAPALREVAEATRGQDVQFVGLVTRDSDASSRAFVGRFGLDYPHVIDSDGTVQLQFRDNLPPQAIPSTLVIDKQGRVAARVLGTVSAATLRSLIEPLQQESA